MSYFPLLVSGQETKVRDPRQDQPVEPQHLKSLMFKSRVFLNERTLISLLQRQYSSYYCCLTNCLKTSTLIIHFAHKSSLGHHLSLLHLDSAGVAHIGLRMAHCPGWQSVLTSSRSSSWDWRPGTQPLSRWAPSWTAQASLQHGGWLLRGIPKSKD